MAEPFTAEAVGARSAEEPLVRAIGVRGLTLSAVNLIIGAAVFVLPALVAQDLGRAAILGYLACAAGMMLVALCFSDLGSQTVLTGGVYAYVEAGFGPFVAFLAANLMWFSNGVLASASVANALVGSAAGLDGRWAGGLPRVLLLVGLYAVLTIINIRGVRGATRFVESAAILKIAPILVVVIVGLFAIQPANLLWSGLPTLQALGRSALLLVFAFSGFETALTVGGEIKDPARTVPRALPLAIGIVALLYCSIHLTDQSVLGDSLAQYPNAPTAETARRLMGSGARLLLLGAALISTFGFLGGDLLASPRMLYALARDGHFPPWLAAVHPRFRTPHVAIATYAVLACGFAISGSFRHLAILASVSTLLIYLLCCLSSLRTRGRRALANRVPPSGWAGMMIPVLAVGMIGWLLFAVSVLEFAAVGVVLILAAGVYALGAVRRR